MGTLRPILVPDRANQRWSLNFVPDVLADRSLSGARMTRDLDELIPMRGQRDMIVSDKGTARHPIMF